MVTSTYREDQEERDAGSSSCHTGSINEEQQETEIKEIQTEEESFLSEDEAPITDRAHQRGNRVMTTKVRKSEEETGVNVRLSHPPNDN